MHGAPYTSARGAAAAHGTREGEAARVRSRGRVLAVASIGVLAIAYTVIAFVLLRPDATYSIDTSVKVIQARTLLQHGFRRSGLPNRGAFIDPQGAFFPLTSPYVFRTSSGWQSIFPTASALLLAPFSPWGLAGVTLPALAGAVLLLWVTWRFGVDVRGAPVLPLVLGLATILWFYATSPNEHALAAALTTSALIVASGDRRHSTWAAGLLLGVAGTLRDEALLVAPGLVAARYLCHARGRAAFALDVVRMALGAVVPIAAIAALDAFVYQRPVSAHLLHAVPPLQQWLPDAHVTGLPALPAIGWPDRVEILVDQWLVGLGTPFEKGISVAALAVAAAAARWTRSGLPLAGVLGILAAWRVMDVGSLVAAPRFVGGLYRLCPFLLFAVVPLPAGIRSSRARQLSLLTAACYLALALVALNTIGGKSFGPRLLFPLLPLLVVAATESIAAWTLRARESRTDGLVGTIGVALVMTSAVMQLGVALPAWAARNHSDYRAVAAIADGADPIVVVDHPSAAQFMPPFYFDRVVLLAASSAKGRALADRLLSARIRSFSVLSRFDPPRLTFAPYILEGQTREGRLVVQRWRR